MKSKLRYEIFWGRWISAREWRAETVQGRKILNMKTKLKHLALIAITLSFLTGCATTGGLNIATTATVAKIAAKDATFFALTQHPEWRPAFQRAYIEVQALAVQDKIDVSTLAAIIARLPVKELRGTTAQIIIGDVQIIVEQLVPNSGQIVSSDKYADPKIIVTAIRDGMKIGLDSTEPVP